MRATPSDGSPDYRGVALCAVLAVVAVIIGVAAVVADEAVLALAAAGVGVVAELGGAALGASDAGSVVKRSRSLSRKPFRCGDTCF